MSARHQDQHFDGFEPHTRLKHSILVKYLEAFLAKLFQRDPLLARVLVVDGFAGRGKDRLGQSGSPVWIARCAATIRDMFSARLGRAVAVDVVLVEADGAACNELTTHMAPFGPSVKVIRGELNDVLPSILADAGDAPGFVFLDPCGIKGLAGEQMASVVARSHSEVFVLVDDDGADRLVRVATVTEPKKVKRLREKARILDMFLDNDETRATVNREIARAVSSLKQTARPSAEYLTAATGGDRWRGLADLSDTAARRAGIVNLVANTMVAHGATYTTRIPVVKATGEAAYTLLHASRSAHGRQAMKEAVQTALNAAGDLGYEKAIIDAIRDAMGTDLEMTIAVVAEEFGGRDVGWTDEMKAFVLRETDTCPWQTAELKEQMKRRGWKNPGKQLSYTIPAAPSPNR